MDNNIALTSGYPEFSPAIADLIAKTTALIKTSIVQELAALETPKLFESNISSKIRSKTHKLSATLRERSNDALGKLYDSEVRSIVRQQNLDLFQSKSPLEQLNVQREFNFVKPELTNEVKLESIRDNLFPMQSLKPTSTMVTHSAFRIQPQLKIHPVISRLIEDTNFSVVTPKPIVANKGLKFRLHEVKAVDETNPEWAGKDEINLGGVASGAEDQLVGLKQSLSPNQA
ncbi:MAG: hypothetical protein ACLFQP_03015 [Halothece sp.]